MYLLYACNLMILVVSVVAEFMKNLQFLTQKTLGFTYVDCCTH